MKPLSLSLPDEPFVQFADITPAATTIKVIGVGGGGGNAVANMYTGGFGQVAGRVQFFVCNTDAKALDDSPVPGLIRIGKLGAGGKPEKGCEAAEAHLDEITRVLDGKTRVVFITAGMGGGTGTGASPVIAREARRRGILTIGIVTLPFLWEGTRQIDKALDGLEKLSAEVDALLIINNQRLLEIYPDMPVLGGFKKADETLTIAVRSIVEIIEMRGTVLLDFEDVSTCLRGGGKAIMSIGTASGEGRITRAIEDALHSPLLSHVDVYTAGRVLIKITLPTLPGYEMRTEELGEIQQFFNRFSTDYEMKYGIDSDASLGENIKVVLLASHFDDPATAPAEADEKQLHRRAGYYGLPVAVRRRSNIFLFEPDELDNAALVDQVDSHPVYCRTRADIKGFRGE